MSFTPSPSRVRVGIVLDSLVVPRWLAATLDQAEGLAGVDTVAYVLRPRPVAEDARNRLAYSLYEQVDRRLFRNDRDPFVACDLAGRQPGLPRLTLGWGDDPLEADALRALAIDVLLVLGDPREAPVLATLASSGVWWLRHGLCAEADSVPPPASEFWANYRGESVYETAVIASRADGAEVIYRSWSSTDQVAFQRGRAPMYWKASAAVVRCLSVLQRGGWAALRNSPCYGGAVSVRETDAIRPTANQVGRHVLRVVTGVARRRIRKLVYREQWSIAYRAQHADQDATPRAASFMLVRPHRLISHADPFVIDHGGRTYLFYEHFDVREPKGTIACATFGAGGIPGPGHVVLERPYHLSYPFVFEHESEIYMIPETARAHRVELYRATHFPLHWEPVKTLIDDVVAVDPTLFFGAGKLWLFANVAAPGAATVDELHLYFADALLGEWVPHPLNPVVSDVRRARPAGRLFTLDGDLIRPSQDCSGRYGRAVVLNRVEILDESRYAESEVGRIQASWIHGILGTHTYASSDSYEVTDAIANRPKYAVLEMVEDRARLARGVARSLSAPSPPVNLASLAVGSASAPLRESPARLIIERSRRRFVRSRRTPRGEQSVVSER